VEAIANLVNATVADRESIAALTNTVARLTVQAATVNEKLVKDLTENKHLSATAAGTNSDPRMEVSYTHYCWTHGPKCSHTSRNYDRHALDHKADATDAEKMGGRTTKWVYSFTTRHQENVHLPIPFK